MSTLLTRSVRFMLTLFALLALAVLLSLAFNAPAMAADGSALPSAHQTSIWADSTQWLLIAGVLTPLITSVVQRPTWPERVRVVVGVVAAVVIGVLTLLANGTLGAVLNDGAHTWLSLLALVIVASATAYKTLWKPSGVALAIENATTPASQRVDPPPR